MRRGDRPPTLVTPAFLAILGATLAYFIALGATIPLLPLFVKGPLSHGSVAVGFASASYAIGALAVRPLVGRLGDRKGRRMLIVGGAAVAAASFALYMVAHSLLVLILLRLMGGIGEAAFFTGTATAVADMAPQARRGEAVSLYSLGLYFGIAVGPFIGETLLGGTHFDRVWLLAAGGIGLASLLGLRVPDTRPEGTAEDRSGGWFNPAAIVPGIVIAMSVWGFAGFESFVPLYARDLHLSGVRYVFLTYAVTVMLVRLFGARIPDRVGPRRTASVSLITSAVGLVGMTLVASKAGLYGGVVVFALGQSLAFPALMTMAVGTSPDSQRSSTIATFTAFVDLGFGLGPAAAGGVVALFGNRAAFVAGAVSAVIGFAVLRTRPEVRVLGDPGAPIPEVSG